MANNSKAVKRRFPVAAPQAFDITVRGEKQKVYFRRITSGERETILLGQVVEGKVGESTSWKVDLGKNDRHRMMLVQFSACESDGAPLFDSLDDVRSEDPAWIAALHEKAESVNKEDDAGKS